MFVSGTINADGAEGELLEAHTGLAERVTRSRVLWRLCADQSS
jgi:hypothetical protein